MDKIGYISVEEAEEYFELFYTSTDERIEAWDDLSDDDKEVYLRNAWRSIDALPFQGMKNSPTQATAFPRTNTGNAVPEKVKLAQAELALVLLQLELKIGLDAEQVKRMQLQSQGVTSIKIGKLAETYKNRTDSAISEDVAIELSEVVKGYLRPWLRGGYDVHGIS